MGAVQPRALQDDLFSPLAGNDADPMQWRPPTEYPRLAGSLVAYDVETRDDHLKTHGPGFVAEGRGYIVGVSFAWFTEQGKIASGYWPVRHQQGTNLPEAVVRAWVQEILGDPNTTAVMHNGLYDLGWTRRWGVTVRARVIDTMLEGALINENRRRYSLDALSKDAFGEGKDETTLRRLATAWGLDPKSHLWLMPPWAVGTYAEGDTTKTLRLNQHHKAAIAKDNLERVSKLEHDLLPVLTAMRWNGVRVDVDGAERMKVELLREEREATDKIRTLCGFPVGINDATSLAKAFHARGITVPQSEGGGDSFTKGWMAEHADPLPRLVVAARTAAKARTTFVQGYILDRHINGRLHAAFPQLPADEGGTVTGRLASYDPNLQNLPAKRHPWGKRIRALFLPEEGQLWAANDYSQQEPRLAVHFAVLVEASGAKQFAQRYIDDPKTDFHDLVGLGKMYGMGGAKLCRDLGKPTKWVTSRRTGGLMEVAGDEGQAIIDKFNAAVPFIAELSDLCQRRSKRRGVIRTLLGRVRRFDPQHPGGALPFKALNCLIQGSAADQTKQAMIDAHADGQRLLVPVHDELGASVADPAQAERLATIMRDAVPLVIPSKIDVAIGRNWGEAL
jgi:DNA polymerase I-like protein with 3'-5' exonuclease and polymerase domains